MARIEEKSKPKLASVIWTWVVVGILSAVVVTGLVLLIIYLVGLGNTEGEKEFPERFTTAEESQFITYEELESLLSNSPVDEERFDTTKEMFVFVYSPDFEQYKDLDVTVNGEEMKLTEFIDTIVEKKLGNFFIYNTESEDNKNHSIDNLVEGLKFPTLLVMGIDTDGFGTIVPDDLEDQIHGTDGVVTLPKQIVSVLLSL